MGLWPYGFYQLLKKKEANVFEAMSLMFWGPEANGNSDDDSPSSPWCFPSLVHYYAFCQCYKREKKELNNTGLFQFKRREYIRSFFKRLRESLVIPSAFTKEEAREIHSMLESDDFETLRATLISMRLGKRR